jgi:hypothetical protein
MWSALGRKAFVGAALAGMLLALMPVAANAAGNSQVYVSGYLNTNVYAVTVFGKNQNNVSVNVSQWVQYPFNYCWGQCGIANWWFNGTVTIVWYDQFGNALDNTTCDMTGATWTTCYFGITNIASGSGSSSSKVKPRHMPLTAPRQLQT